MKKAVAHLENYLERTADYTKGTVVLATVFGDVHDIGKSLVNTILSNNGYTVLDLGKQVPVSTIIDAAIEHNADAIGLSALLVSTSKQMPLAVQELHRAGPEVPGPASAAPRSTATSPTARCTSTAWTTTPSTRPASSTARTPSRASAVMDRLVDKGELPQMLEEIKAGAIKQRNAVEEDEDLPPVDDDSVRSPARTDAPVPTPPFWGVQRDPGRHGRALPPPRHPRAVQAALGRPGHQGRRLEASSSKGPADPDGPRSRASCPSSSACGPSRTTCTRAR